MRGNFSSAPLHHLRITASYQWLELSWCLSLRMLPVYITTCCYSSCRSNCHSLKTDGNPCVVFIACLMHQAQLIAQ
uniref:Uncharacterized protein n=1 Tax=Chelonoidis abingdonii TaxID=106734 RepID=A0A8C0GX30_CHEAB